MLHVTVTLGFATLCLAYDAIYILEDQDKDPPKNL